MGDFKDRLWRDLVREHGAQLAQTERPPAKHGRRARPRVLAGTTLGLAGIGTAVALALGAASSTPAFAVTRNHDGTVTVALQRIAAIRDANAKLAGSGLPVKLVRVQAGCVAAARAKALAALSKARPQSVAPLHWSGRARFNPRKIPPGKTLVIAAWPAGKSVHVSPGHLITGAAPACVPPPAPPPGACAISKLPPSSKVPTPARAPAPARGAHRHQRGHRHGPSAAGPGAGMQRQRRARDARSATALGDAVRGGQDPRSPTRRRSYRHQRQHRQHRHQYQQRYQYRQHHQHGPAPAGRGAGLQTQHRAGQAPSATPIGLAVRGGPDPRYPTRRRSCRRPAATPARVPAAAPAPTALPARSLSRRPRSKPAKPSSGEPGPYGNS